MAHGEIRVGSSHGSRRGCWQLGSPLGPHCGLPRPIWRPPSCPCTAGEARQKDVRKLSWAEFGVAKGSVAATL